MIDWKLLARRLGIALNLREPPSLPPYGWSYYDHLVGLYATLKKQDSIADDVIEKAAIRPYGLNWGDLFRLESIIFSLQPPEVIERSAWILRERLREMTCSSVYDKYLASGIPTETDTPEKQSRLRADLIRLLDVLHWYYALVPIREQVRKSLTLSCIWMVFLYTVVLGGILIWCYVSHSHFLAVLACVLYLGIVGGFVSSQRRMQGITSDADPLISVFGLDNAGYYLWLSPLLGAVFAVILMFMFVAGILKGSVFPEFFVSNPGHHNGLPFFSFTWNTLPTTSEEYAKLFVWAFLAGFAERLVPDSLDRLASKLQRADNPGAAGPNNSANGQNRVAPNLPTATDGQVLSPETRENIAQAGEVQHEMDS